MTTQLAYKGCMVLMLGAMVLATACSPQAPGNHAKWDNLMTTTKVAKVNNIKSLISPGFQ